MLNKIRSNLANLHPKIKTRIAIGLFAFLLALMTSLFYSRFGLASDWALTFYPAARDLLQLRNVYASSSYSFLYPVWVLLPVLPFALLPVQLSNALISIVSLSVIGYVAYKRGAKPLPLALYTFMPQTLFMAGNGAFIEAFTAIGFILPPRTGLFFVLVKPQIGAAVALYWLIEAWRAGGIRQVWHVFAPVLTVYALFLIAHSPNLLDKLAEAPNVIGMGAGHDVNLWPYGIVLGVALLTLAVRKQSMGPAILSSICFSPYVPFYSWPVALLGLLPRQWEFGLACFAMAILGFITL